MQSGNALINVFNHLNIFKSLPYDWAAYISERLPARTLVIPAHQLVYAGMISDSSSSLFLRLKSRRALLSGMTAPLKTIFFGR